MKIQSTTALKQEMRAVARGEQSTPADAALPSIESAAALLCVLTPTTAPCCAQPAMQSRNPWPNSRH